MRLTGGCQALVKFIFIAQLIYTVYVTKNDRSFKRSSPLSNEIVTLFFVCALYIHV